MQTRRAWRLAGRRTVKQVHKQGGREGAGWQASKRAGGQTGRLADGQATKQAASQAGRQVGGQAGKRAGRQAGRCLCVHEDVTNLLTR